MRGVVVDTDKSGKAIENDTVFVDALNDVVYIDDTVYGDKAVREMTVKSLDEEYMKAAKSQGRCDGRWGARINLGEGDGAWTGRYRDAYLAEHVEGAKDRAREPHRWGGQEGAAASHP